MTVHSSNNITGRSSSNAHWDDEHGCDEDDGCYANTINLSEKMEPDIYHVSLEDQRGKLVPEYFDMTETENGRVSYPIFHIGNHVSVLFVLYFLLLVLHIHLIETNSSMWYNMIKIAAQAPNDRPP